MVEISLSGSGEGPGWVTASGYSTGGTRRPITYEVTTLLGVCDPLGGGFKDPCLWIQGSLFSSPRGPFSVCRYQLRKTGTRVPELRDVEITDLQQSKRRIEATLNGGGGNIEASTSNGTITFQTFGPQNSE